MGTQRDEGLREVQTLINKELNKEQYDPQQSEEIRRELRVQYRNLTEKTIGTILLLLFSKSLFNWIHLTFYRK